MKPITEEQRQALIKFIGAAFESMKGNDPVNPDEFDIEEMTLQALEIALASLTAKPVSRVIDDRCGQQIGGIPVSDMVDSVWSVGTVFYTAPPVSAIKLPGSFQDAFEENNDIPSQTSRCGDGYCSHSFNNWKGQEFINEFNGFRKGIDYVKRLNGLE